MSNIAVRKRLSTTAELSTITAVAGEVYVDQTKTTLVVHDGSTAGGVPLAKETHTHANATTGTAGFMSAVDKIKLDDLSAAGGLQTILSDTVALTARTIANFNTDFTVADNSGSTRTDFSISQTFRNEVNSNTVALIIALS